MTTDERPELNGSTCLSLLRQALDQDSDAWRRVVWLYAPLITRWCRQAGLAEHDAADVGQEVFLAAAEGLPNFRRERTGDSFRGWLWGITQNKVKDHFRKVARTPDPLGGTTALNMLHALPEAAPADNSDLEIQGERSCLVTRALLVIRGDFEEKTWLAFWQVTVEEQSPNDVAVQLGMTPVGVRKAKSRVLARLREELHFLTR